MHVISLRALKDFWARYPPSQGPLSTWHEMMERLEFDNFVELRRVFSSADLVGGKIVFNIGGNKYRLITTIHFNRHKVFVRDVLTHAEYDKGAWK